MSSSCPFRWIFVVLAVACTASLAAWYAFRGYSPTNPHAFTLIERCTIEETVPVAGVQQPFKYVDAGTQAAGEVRPLYVAIYGLFPRRFYRDGNSIQTWSNGPSEGWEY